MFCSQLPRQHPMTPTSLEGHPWVAPCPTVPGLICVTNKIGQKSPLRLGFQRLSIPCGFLSLILITCSRGMLHHEELYAEGTMGSEWQPGEWAWNCLAQCLSQLQRLQRLPMTCTQSPKRLWARTTWLSVLLLPIPGSLETEWDNPCLLF